MLGTSRFGSVSDEIVGQIDAVVGADNYSTAQAQRELHSKDQSMFRPSLPDIVVWVETAEQVAAILKLASSLVFHHRLGSGVVAGGQSHTPSWRDSDELSKDGTDYCHPR